MLRPVGGLGGERFSGSSPDLAHDGALEREADRAASQVLMEPPGGSHDLNRWQSQRSAEFAGTDRAAVPDGVQPVLAAPGQPLEPALREDMERRFGHDFSRVRVHADSAAGRSARAVAAQAYTVGQDVVFASGRYSPGTRAGRWLLAHELAHVVQQSGVADTRSPGVAAMATAPRLSRFTGVRLQRHRDDLVAYSGGQSGLLHVIDAGRWIYTARAVSGHPSHGENEPGVGPIPSGDYLMHPGKTRATVASIQSGVCGARAIPSGFQEITSTDPSPCTGAHYCNVPCPSAADPARKCFTPRDCWGPYRIKIEGSKAVVTPSGDRRTRSGFYLHGGNPADAVTSGCIKSLDDGVFAKIRTLSGVRGAVPMCVGGTCAPAVNRAVAKTVAEGIADITRRVTEVLP